jgi:2-polyprenyl-3-methyl-5-hydroxy-6-metoxy-1,4-benzoquinol methylase
MTRADLTAAYRDKPASYYANARHDYVAALPDNPEAVICEIGCGSGATGALALAAGKCRSYVGVEMFEPMARDAARTLTALHFGDVETIALPYGPSTFDVLICSEILEHLVDPEATLRRLSELLKPNALVFASSPNVSQWRVICELLTGRFDYADQGVMDRTHLRWFTPKTYREMFERCGFDVLDVGPIAMVPAFRRILKSLNAEHLFGTQIDLRARKHSG